MATEVKPTGNLGQVLDATTPAQIVRQQQSYPFKAWYAVVVRSGREQDAADGFRREGVLSYWPNYERLTPSSLGRRRLSFAPIFPGMLFSPTADFDLFWMAVQRITLVISVLRKEGGQPATLTNGDIEKIREIEAGENNPPAVKPVHNFKPGQKVRFSDDCVTQWPPGKITRLVQDGRISVEVYLMGRMVPILVLPHQIEAM